MCVCVSCCLGPAIEFLRPHAFQELLLYELLFKEKRAEERRLMNLVPAPAVKLMKGRVLSRPGRKKCPSICPVICILRIMISSSFTYRIKIINTIILEFGTFGHILVTEFHFLNLMFSYFIRIEFLVSL